MSQVYGHISELIQTILDNGRYIFVKKKFAWGCYKKYNEMKPGQLLLHRFLPQTADSFQFLQLCISILHNDSN